MLLTHHPINQLGGSWYKQNYNIQRQKINQTIERQFESKAKATTQILLSCWHTYPSNFYIISLGIINAFTMSLSMPLFKLRNDFYCCFKYISCSISSYFSIVYKCRIIVLCCLLIPFIYIKKNVDSSRDDTAKPRLFWHCFLFFMASYFNIVTVRGNVVDTLLTRLIVFSYCILYIVTYSKCYYVAVVW